MWVASISNNMTRGGATECHTFLRASIFKTCNKFKPSTMMSFSVSEMRPHEAESCGDSLFAISPGWRAFSNNFDSESLQGVARTCGSTHEATGLVNWVLAWTPAQYPTPHSGVCCSTERFVSKRDAFFGCLWMGDFLDWGCLGVRVDRENRKKKHELTRKKTRTRFQQSSSHVIKMRAIGRL